MLVCDCLSSCETEREREKDWSCLSEGSKQLGGKQTSERKASNNKRTNPLTRAEQRNHVKASQE